MVILPPIQIPGAHDRVVCVEQERTTAPMTDFEGRRATGSPSSDGYTTQMSCMLNAAATNLYLQRFLALQESVEAMAIAQMLTHSHAAHRPALMPSQGGPSGFSNKTESLLAACLATMPSPKTPYDAVGALTSTYSSSTPSPAASSVTSPSMLPRLPALSALLTACTSSSAMPAGKGPDLAVRARKKYRNRFSLEEEEALVAFWFTHRSKYSVKSKILWRIAERNGVTERDAVSVQKHFDHILKHGRMRDLFRTFRRKGRLNGIIDLIDVEKDFSPPSGDAGDLHRYNSTSDNEEAKSPLSNDVGMDN
jgi:hypothetical protein